eukprot:scaffold147684_cov83-Cyclotella_meneghiniana.AAC.2
MPVDDVVLSLLTYNGSRSCATISTGLGTICVQIKSPGSLLEDKINVQELSNEYGYFNVVLVDQCKGGSLQAHGRKNKDVGLDASHHM